MKSLIRPTCRVFAVLACGAGLQIGTAQAMTTVTIESMGLPGSGNIIQNVLPFFGSTPEVTLNWNPTADASRALVNWLGAYSGRDAAYCGGIDCTLDLLANPGWVATLDSFRLGGWPNTDRQIRWSVIDLANGNVVAGGAPTAPTVSGTTGLAVPVGASSTVGLRILFGPDGFNGGINDIRFSATPVPEPASWALWLAGLAGIALLARRRSA